MTTRRIQVYIGKFLYAAIGAHLPASYFPVNIGQKKFRAFCGKLILAHCGKDVNIENKAAFSSKVTLGDRSGIGIAASIGGETHIGNDVMMGPHCTIYTRNHKTADTTTTMRGQGFTDEEPVYIGDDVWIGGNVTILPGVRIGSHSIIGACAVVTKDVPEWAVAVGNPAAVKKFRKNIGGGNVLPFPGTCYPSNGFISDRRAA